MHWWTSRWFPHPKERLHSPLVWFTDKPREPRVQVVIEVKAMCRAGEKEPSGSL